MSQNEQTGARSRARARVEESVNRAHEVLREYHRELDDGLPLDGAHMVSLVTDLMHLCDRAGWQPFALIRDAKHQFGLERVRDGA